MKKIKSCSVTIERCIGCLNSTLCLICDSEYYLEDGKCYELTKEITNKCSITIPRNQINVQYVKKDIIEMNQYVKNVFQIV